MASVYYNEIPIYPIFYQINGAYRLQTDGATIAKGQENDT